MTKAEVIFDDWKILVNGFEILIQHDYDYVLYEIYKGDDLIEQFESSVEKAVKYCMEYEHD